MGFKCITQDELETKSNTCLIGVPLRKERISALETRSKIESLQRTTSRESASEILIKNEEVLEFQYHSNKRRKSVDGYGSIAISNNSSKDRIWDAKLWVSGSKYNDIESEMNTHLGILEPESRKNIRYEIINTEDLSDLLKITEDIEISNDQIEIMSNYDKDSEDIENNELSNKGKKRFLLLLGQENTIKYSISLENTSSYILEDIKFKKYYSKHLYDIEFQSDVRKNVKVQKDHLEWTFKELKPSENIQITIFSKILPRKSETIRTGNIELSYILRNNTVSELNITNFSAYSHAMHSIEKTEQESEPNNWECSLKFENHSDFLMTLKSILILDKEKINRYFDLNFNTAEENGIINPGNTYISDSWKVKDENEPKFSRKIEYSVNYKVEKYTIITTQLEDTAFESVNTEITKEISEKEIKSYEESKIHNTIIVKNMGTIPINALTIREVIPKDFLPPMEKSNYYLKNSIGNIKPGDFIFDLQPNDDDASKEHIVELKINLINTQSRPAMNVDDILELKYPITAITPNYETDYEFPLEVSAYYLLYDGNGLTNSVDYYAIKNHLQQNKQPSLKVTHTRRKWAIEKEIFPGKDTDDFAISVTVKNKSNVEIKDFNITDTFPETFELVSTNLKHKLSKSDEDGTYTISFTIEKILPYQEKEVMYYLKNTGDEVNFSELESFLFG